MKYVVQLAIVGRKASLPVRGAWVEMHFYSLPVGKLYVAPRAGSVG